ncbi:hypothetical protein Glove_158g108 [Diversispora epigaea]|uniref:Uncharacterized protein n=1 Tax=Diversispora epigaea TaxID=1348612 RepID=A0A397IUE3_9GLOM|nr:hypothetical protein Glove_158g108 [Diversispora epigaea]
MRLRTIQKNLVDGITVYKRSLPAVARPPILPARAQYAGDRPRFQQFKQVCLPKFLHSRRKAIRYELYVSSGLSSGIRNRRMELDVSTAYQSRPNGGKPVRSRQSLESQTSTLAETPSQDEEDGQKEDGDKEDDQ